MHKLKSRIVNCTIFVLILLLTIATMMTIQIRNENENKKAVSVNNQESVKQAEKMTSNITKQNTIVNEKAAQTDYAINDKYIYPTNGEIIKKFSDTQLLYSSTMDDWRIHCGIDINVEQNNKVYSVYEGNIIEILNDDIYGTTVIIQHPEGIVSKYTNIQPVNELNINSKIKCGELIGEVLNNPGCEINDQLHLHFEMYKNGLAIDPLSLLNK